MKIQTALLGVLLLGFQSLLAIGADNIPDCLDKEQTLPIDNPRVVDLKHNTPNQYLARAHVAGKVLKITNNRKTHLQFLIDLGRGQGGKPETLEVIFNKEFGDWGLVKVGGTVEACGDYITSNAQAGNYPPSPAGAIIHWVHFSTTPAKHEHGYMVVDGTLVGDDLP